MFLHASQCHPDHNQVHNYMNSKTLPQHNGLLIVLNIFLTDLGRDKKLKISLYDGDSLENSEQITINKNVGSNINKNAGNQMIYSYAFRSNGHSRTQNVNLRIQTQQGGIYVRQFQVYLKDCNKCIEDELVYTFGYIPRYHYEGNVTQGLDIWLEFNKKLQNTSNPDLKKAFTFSFIELPGVTLEPTQFYDESYDNNQRFKYFIPLKFSFINYTLAINSTQDQRIFAKIQPQAPQNIRRMLTRMLLVSQLNNPRNQEIVDRFTSFKSDDQISANQLYWFFRTIQWFVLIVMIVCAFFGIGVIFEDFSIVLQILFLHVYISSNLLPATYKAPMWGLQRMQNLNFFSDPDIANIQSLWFGDLVYPSPYVFQQYNIDIYFARSFYPIIIINLIYLGWFIILALLNKFVRAFKNSQFIGAIFLRSIPERPINYFDQIWRYQFLTTCWASLMQFHNLNGRNDTQRLNIALCFIAFIISLIWPIFIIIYTYRKTLYNYSTNFNYYYEDIFFKKHQSFGEENWKYYLYIAIRFLRILGIALFIALFTRHELVGAIVLIFLNLIEIIYIAELRIFVKDILAFFLKFAENILLIFIEIALLVVYGTSNTMDQRSFLNLGYAILVMYVIIIVFAFIRFIYYAYSKFKYYRLKFYGVDGGDKKTYGMKPLPKTDRE